MKFQKIILLTALLFLPMADLVGHSAYGEGSSQGDHQKKYYCVMHPQVTSDKPGDCPICHMRLVLRSDSTAGADMAVWISPEKQQLLGIRTEPLKARHLQRTLEAWGRVAHDPPLYELQLDFLRQERLNYERERDRTPLAQRRSLTGQEKAAIQLLDMGLSPEWIDALRVAGVPDERLVFHHLAQGVWAYVQIPEQDVSLVQKGDAVKLRAASLPGIEFEGRVEYMDTMIDQETRTLRARVLAEQVPAGVKPMASLSAFFTVDLGTVPAVPEEAVLITGKKVLVYVEEDGHFRPRPVILGQKAGGFYEIRDGLALGEKVAVNGNFFLDSDSKMRAL